MRSLDIVELKNPVLMPAIRSGLSRPKLLISGFASDGKPHPAFVLRRHSGDSGDSPASKPERHLRGEWIYGGVFFGHWGHFLLESLARIWMLQSIDAPKIIWHSFNPSRSMIPWQRCLLDLVGVSTAEHYFVRKPTLVDKLQVPEPGYVLGKSFNYSQMCAMSVYPFLNVQRGRKLWLSRSRLEPEEPVGQGVLESSLSSHGWTIFHPQEHSPEVQLNKMSQAEIIGGFEGSAFHTLILGSDIRARIRIVNKRPAIGLNYHIIASAKKMNQVVCRIPLAYSHSQGGKMIYRLKDVSAAVDLIDM